MEHILTWKSSKRLAVVLLISIISLVGLLSLAQQVNAPLVFVDPNLEQVVREKINKPSGPIYRNEISTVTELDASGRQIQHLDGLQAFRKLVVLNLADNAVQNLQPLARLRMLKVLNLANNQIADLEVVGLGAITHLSLRELNLQGNAGVDGQALRDISLLGGLTALEVLNLRNNQIQDLAALANLRNLRELDLRDNQVETIEPLRELSRLESLNLRGNLISDLEPLARLNGLTYLNIHSNPVVHGVHSLAGLTRLETLIMRNVYIGEAYGFLENLTRLQRLNIRNTGIEDVAVIGRLMQAGALQDNPETGVKASIDMLQVAPSGSVGDPYESMRRYWDNISTRYPLSLPYYPSPVSAPNFSHQSGFFSEEFFLTLTTDEPGGKIFFTLDGSEPALAPDLTPLGTTLEFTQALWIENRANQPNLLSKITTGFWPTQDAPPSPVFKGSVIRAIVVTPEGNRSSVATHTYFVDAFMADRYSLPVISIATDPDYLFDDALGIYVPGDLYQPAGPDQHWSEGRANYFERGLKWERPIHFQMLAPQGNLLLDFDAGIRIHGGFTRMFNQKSLRLYARPEYDGQGFIQFDFFPDLNDRLYEKQVDTFSTVILRNGGNAWLEVFFRDVLAHDLLTHTTLDIQGFMPVVVFINGEYWGLHNIRNRYDTDYFKTYHGIEPEELVVLDNMVGHLNFGNPGDEAGYLSLLTSIDENYIENDYPTVETLSDPDLYAQFVNSIDIDNFILFQVANIYYGNTDWPQNNIRIWRKKVDITESLLDQANHGHDGRWRWMIFDIDHGFKNPSRNTLANATEGNRYRFATFLLRSLLQNEKFKNQFINTFADQLNTTFREAVVLDKINAFEALYAPEIEEQIHRWGNLDGSLAAWFSNVAEVRAFASARPDHQRRHIINYFDLLGSATITVQTDPSRGHIRINTVDLLENTVGVDDPGNWSGVYFQGVPVTLTAIPFEGYRFAGWQGIDQLILDSMNPEVQLLLEGDLVIVAVFVEE